MRSFLESARSWDDTFWNALKEQVPILVLLGINTGILPAAIDFISNAERSARKSTIEDRRLFMNFGFLFLNTVVVPFVGVPTVADLTRMLIDNAREFLPRSSADDVAQLHDSHRVLMVLLISIPGSFAIRYVLSAIFIQNATELLQAPKRILRWFKLTFLAVTPKQRLDASRPVPFRWGYWYAWTLSILGLGLCLSITCPVLPLLVTVFFFMKYAVDKHNLTHDVFTLEMDIQGLLAVRVMFFMRLIVGVWWVLVGAVCMTSEYSLTRLHQEIEHSDAAVHVGGVLIILLGVATIAVAEVLKLRTLHDIALRGHVREAAPSWQEALSDVMLLKHLSCDKLAIHGEAEEQEEEEQEEVEQPEDSTPEECPEDMVIWNGPKILGLTPQLV